MRGYKNKTQLLIAFLVVGFLSGVVYENVITRNQVASTELFLKSNLQRYLQTDMIAEKYFRYVVGVRVVLLLIICIFSCIKWKKIFVTMCLTLIGFFTGVFCVSAVLQLGMKGILLCIAGMFPHMLFYGLLYGMLFVHWFRFPERQWNRTKTVFVVVLFIIGIFLEVYVNPIIVKFIIGIL